MAAPLEENLTALFRAIDLCRAQSLILPMMMLVYSGIDIVAALERDPSEGIEASFTRWVDRYLLPSKPLACSSIDLYAARCGIIHTFSADSDLSKKGKAHKLIYAWGNARQQDLRKALDRLGHKTDIAMHINELVEAFRLGVEAFLHDLDSDPPRRQRVLANATWLSDLPENTMAEFFVATGLDPERTS